VRNVRERQQKAADDTERLDGQRQKQEGRLTPAQEATLAGVSREQDALRGEVGAMIEGLSAAKAFVLALEAAAADMDLAIESLGRQDTGPAAREAQRAAVARLDQMLEALKPEKPDDKGGSSGGNGPGQGKQQRAGGGLQMLAEFKLLKILQESINGRTAALDKKYAGQKNPGEAAGVEYRRLSEEQGRLAALVDRMVSEQPAPEDTPDLLPGPQPKPEPKPSPPGVKPVDPLQEEMR
jgi:hypothetical protein